MFRCLLLTSFLFTNFIKADNFVCPPGTIRSPNGQLCYSFNSKPLDYFGAKSECNLQGGHLAYIDSPLINAGIGATTQNLSWEEYWIGANVVKQLSNDAIIEIWVWTDSNRLVTFSDWYVNEPKSKNYCAYGKTSDFTWVSASCAETKPFVCSIPVKINVCDDGWTHFSESNSCYKVFYNKNWNDAEDYCQKQNAHLTSIHSVNENTFVFDLAKSGYAMVTHHNSTWIGFNTQSVDKSILASYKWTDGSGAAYFNWQINQPDNNNDENCVHMYSDSFTNHVMTSWNNYPCYYTFRNFVCKKPANSNHCPC